MSEGTNNGVLDLDILGFLREEHEVLFKGWDGYNIKIEMEETNDQGVSTKEIWVTLSNKPARGDMVSPYAIIEFDYDKDTTHVRFWKDLK